MLPCYQALTHATRPESTALRSAFLTNFTTRKYLATTRNVETNPDAQEIALTMYRQDHCVLRLLYLVPMA